MSDQTPYSMLYPFRPRGMRIDGHRMNYVDEGEGQTLLFVHGNPTWSFYWRDLLGRFREQYRVVAPDHIGCGLSDKPDNFPYRLADHIDKLNKFIEALDLREITLVGHDWGGAIGMGSALAAPERFSRFVFMNTAVFRAESIPWRLRLCRIPYLGTVAVRGLNLFSKAALRMAVRRKERITPQVRAGYLAPYNSWRNRIAVHRFVLDIPLRAGHPSYATLADIEAGVDRFADTPVLLIWGMRDWCFSSRCLEQFVELFPQAEPHRIEEAGHWVVEDAPEEVAALMESFLQSHATPQSPPTDKRPASS